MTTRLLGVASVLLSVASVAAAQEALPTRIRLTTTDGRRLSFELLRVDAEGLVGRQSGRLAEPSRTIPFDQVLRAERSLGRRRGRNATIGAVVGGAIGAVLLWYANSDASAEGCNVGACVPIFVLAPAAAGAGLGAAFSSERWEPVPLGAPRGPSARGREGDRQREQAAPLALKFTVRF